MCSILIISQILKIQMESHQIKIKFNIHIYNFHEDTKTLIGTESCGKVGFPMPGKIARPC